MHYRSIFVSDVHLGSKDAKAQELENFLKLNTCECLYLVGDIIDGWKAQKNKLRWKNSHTGLLRHILKLSKNTKVIYLTGNHDEFLRVAVPYSIILGNIELHDQYEHVAVDGKKYLVVHGDLFDGITKLAPWLSYLGDKGYDFILTLNGKYNWIRHRLGFGYWSFSKFLKHQVKSAVDFIFKFENNITNYAALKGYTGVICGHIHHAEIKTINNIVYMNSGDWVESMSALVEHTDGHFELVLSTK